MVIKSCSVCNSDKVAFGGSEFEPEKEGTYEVIFICDECNSVFATIYETKFIGRKLIKDATKK